MCVQKLDSLHSQQKGVFMPTSSITKKFIIKDDKTCDRLIAALAETKPQQIKKSSNSYEKGKEKLAYYFGH